MSAYEWQSFWEAIHQPGPTDPPIDGPDRDDWPGQRAADQRADEAADLDYERRTA